MGVISERYGCGRAWDTWIVRPRPQLGEITHFNLVLCADIQHGLHETEQEADDGAGVDDAGVP